MNPARILPRFFPALILLSLLGAWESLARHEVIPSALFPPPSWIFKALAEAPLVWQKATLETAVHSFQGFLLSFVIGSALALIFHLLPLLKKWILPISIFFQTIPIVAIAPLLVIYFGFGAPTVVAASFIVSLFPVIASGLMGLEAVANEKIELFQLYGASRWQTLLSLRIPGAFLNLYSGLQVTIGLSIVGTVAGEFVAGSGLGSLIDVAKTAQRVDQVFAAFLLLALMGLVYLQAIKKVFQCFLRYRPFVPRSTILD